MAEIRVVEIDLSILFHYYKKHKDALTLVRCWAIATFMDARYAGYVELEPLLKYAGISKRYLKRVVKKDECLFRSVSDNRAYLNRIIAIKRTHRLPNEKIRRERMTKKFFQQFKTKKKFLGYICKCYMEQDLRERKPKNYTQGRISYEALAKSLNISRRTAISNLKNSTAKAYPNIRHFKNVRFANLREFGIWLNSNIDERINGQKVTGNLFGYRTAWDKKGGYYYLTRVMPNVYKFTGYKKS